MQTIHQSWYSVTKHCSSLVCNIQYCHTQPSHANIMRLSGTLGHDSENTDDNSENIYEDGTWHNEFLDSHSISSNEEEGTVLPQKRHRDSEQPHPQ